MSSLRTRIPRPTPSVDDSQPLKVLVSSLLIRHSVIDKILQVQILTNPFHSSQQDDNLPNSRKRKPNSSPSVKSEPASKKKTLDTGATSTIRPPTDEPAWEIVSVETGLSIPDCLALKLSFPKRADAKTKVDALVAHVKRLRAAGWYLQQQSEDLDNELETVTEKLEKEAAGRKTDAEIASTTLHAAEKATATAREEATKLKSSLEDANAQLDGARVELAISSEALAAARLSCSTLEGQLQVKTAEAEEASERATSLKEQLSEAQKYAASLQQYNERIQGELSTAQEAASKAKEEKVELAEEAAALRGKVAALEEQIAQAQASGTNSEAARGNALEEAARTRGELSVLSTERAAALAEAARLRSELDECRRDLDRYKDATGKDLAALEEEKATKSVLETRTKAQAELNANLADQAALFKEQRDLAESRAEKNGQELAALRARVAELELALQEAETRVRDGEIMRRKLHNAIQELKGNIRVFCRVRPLSSEEGGGGGQQTDINKVALFSVPASGEGKALEVFQPSKGGTNTATDREQKHNFTFDRVFSPEAPQEEVFEELSHLVQSALDGYKVCCFAYGQTGSGKTHTMLGSQDNPGLIPRAMHQVFETAQHMAAAAAAANQQGGGWKWDMKAAMLEVYNEDIHDLLGPGPPAGKKHTISHDDKGNTTVSHLHWVDVADADKVSFLLNRAMEGRAVGATAMNDRSSRSHFVFTLAIEGTNSSAGQKVKGLLHMIDLAGSERLDRSQVAGDRLKETQSINKSLSALGDVVSSLANKDGHVPFRNSKLTYLLQHSLSGSGKALMVVNVSPALDSLPETLCSLRFAAKVNTCEIGTAKRQITMNK
jgi:kinesin family protein C1